MQQEGWFLSAGDPPSVVNPLAFFYAIAYYNFLLIMLIFLFT